MITFYVTFDCGTIFNGYHAVFQAANEDIVRAFMNKRYKSIWSSIYKRPPAHSTPLQGKPEALYYCRAEDVA